MIHPAHYDISQGPVHDNVILWPCLGSGSRKHKSVSLCDRSRRRIIYLRCTAKNRTTQQETSKQTTFMSIMWYDRYDQSPEHGSILLWSMVYTLFSLLGDKAIFSGFLQNAAALQGFELSQRHIMDSSIGLSDSTNCHQSSLQSSLKETFICEPDSKADLAYTEWHQFPLSGLLIIPIPLFLIPSTPPSFSPTQYFLPFLFPPLMVFCFSFPQLGPAPPILNPCSS